MGGGEDAHLRGDGAKTGREADALDRERRLDPETDAALADVEEGCDCGTHAEIPERRRGVTVFLCSNCGAERGRLPH